MPDPESLEPLWLLLADFQLAIEEEIEAVLDDLARRGLDRPIAALSGRARGEAGPGHRYAFQIAGGIYDIRPDDRVRVRTIGRESLGMVHRFERGLGLLQVKVPEWLGERTDGAELEFDPTWLLRELSERLIEIADRPQDFFPGSVLGLFGVTPPRLGDRAPCLAASEDLNRPQREALARVLGSSTQLVWGPPGTGKSRLVARAALELAEGGRVLVTATTNGAVDEVAGRLASIADPALLEASRIIRVGSDFTKGADERLDLEAALSRRIAAGAGGIDRRLETLEAALGVRPPGGAGGAARSHPSPRARVGRLMAIARARDDREAGRALGHIMLALSRQVEQLLEEASVVLTTFARLSVREELRDLRYESLLIDEASTASLPYAALAASRVAGPVVAVGDFQQLPPVVASRGAAARRCFRRDLFRETGVVGEEDGSFSLPSPNDRLCAMLDVQYRMAPEIRALVSEFFYDGRLRDAPEVAERGRDGPPVVLLDTTALNPRVERADGSRRNPVHADVVQRLLARAGRDGVTDIAVVSPYRAQTGRLRDVVRRGLGASAPRGLEISTIHRFQGRERRLIIIDTVDAPPGRSWFLDESRNPDFPRLLNVALSRARQTLVVVAAVDGLRTTLPPESLLNRLLARIATTGARVSGEGAGHGLRIGRPGP